MVHHIVSYLRNMLRSLHPQRGAFLVLFAITLPFLIAFSALSIDLGSVYVQRVRLQNAADAAALAGAWQLGDSSDDPAVNSAVFYTQKNSPDGTAVTSSDSTMPSEEKQINLYSLIQRPPEVSPYSTIEVQLRERIPLYFFRYFGMENMPIAVTATAKYVPGETNSLFSSAIIGASTDDDSIYFNHPSKVIGTMQTNGKIWLDGPNEATLDGNLIGSTSSYSSMWANSDHSSYNPQSYNVIGVNADNYTQGSVNISLDQNNASTKEIRDYIDSIKNMTLKDRQNAAIYYDGSNKDYTFSASTSNISDYPHLTSGDAQLTSDIDSWKVWTMNYHIIIVDGSLSVNMASGHEPGDNDYAILISLNGNITVRAGSTFKGIIYAPNGTVTFQESSPLIEGSVVGNKVLVQSASTIKHMDLNIPGITTSSSNSLISTKARVSLIN